MLICIRCGVEKDEMDFNPYFKKLCKDCVFFAHQQGRFKQGDKLVFTGVEISPEYKPFPLKEKEALEKSCGELWSNPKFKKLMRKTMKAQFRTGMWGKVLREKVSVEELEEEV